jgi:hypothetical protein
VDADADAGAETATDAESVVHGWASRTPDVLPASWPSARSKPALVYDRHSKRLVLYGGVAKGRPSQETWEWDGSTGLWTLVPAAPPSVASMVAATWDDADQSVVLFGGTTFADGKPSSTLWGYASAWTAWGPTSAAAPWPSAQVNALLAYDAARARLVLVGSGAPAPTWEWDVVARTWSPRATSASPTNDLGAFAWDEGRHVGVFFGNGPWGVTWEWDGVAGVWNQKQFPVQGAPAPGSKGAPAPRTFSAAAYDSDAGRVLLFGGGPGAPEPGIINTWMNDLWEWDGTSWTLLNEGFPLIAPSDRQAHALAYDPDRHCLVLFGGNTPNGDVNDIWEWRR